MLDEKLHGGRVRLSKSVQGQSRSQSSNFRLALNMFLHYAYSPHREHGNPYDYLIVTRYDLRLLRPIPSWACHSTPDERAKLGIASKCQNGGTFHTFGCTYDTMYVVPRAHVPAFNRSIGQSEAPGSRSYRCCFNEICMAGGVPATGQACYHIFTRKLARNESDISFCFAPPSHGGMRPPNGPDYQCCSRGLTNWTLVWHTEAPRDPSGRLAGFAPSNASFGTLTLADKYKARPPG